MSKVKEKNCRLCLKTLDDEYLVINESIREIFETLLLQMDLSVSEEPVVCMNCMESAQEAFKFKSACISVDEQIFSLATERNAADLDIRDVYLNKNENKSRVFSEDYNICRLCLQCLENFNLINDLRNNATEEMLLKCIPELDLNTIKEPMVCTTCMKSLETFYSFTMKCRDTEENIMKYCEVQEADHNGQISLSNVMKFQVKAVPECINNSSEAAAFTNNLFKNEGDTSSDIKNIVLKIEEEFITKDEIEYEDCKTGENGCGETRHNELVNYDMLIHKVSLDVAMFRCALCTFESKNRKNVQMHMLCFHKDKSQLTTYKCNLCSYESNRKSSLTVHMLTHEDSSNVEIYKCETCLFETRHKDYLKRHMLKHKDNSEITMYKCNLCSYEAKWKHYLKNHMLSHKDSSDAEMYRCEKCTFETKRKTNLKLHMLTHKDKSELTMYKCKLCSYEAKWKPCLNKHMLTHKNSSDVVMYRCEKCTFETKYKSSVKIHILSHKDKSEVATYKCNLCSYESKRKSYLKDHMLTHMNPSDVVMYRCERCTYESKYKCALKRHILTHKDNSEAELGKSDCN